MADNHQPTIDIGSEDFGFILCGAVQYTLGKNIYLTGILPGFIRPLLPYLNTAILFNLQKEISECQNYGNKYDTRNWRELLLSIYAEIKRRG